MTNQPQDATEWRPRGKQAKALLAGLKLGLDRNITCICDEIGVARSTFYRWLDRDPMFAEAWNTQWEKLIDRHMYAISAAMTIKAIGGDIGAARLATELAGKLKNRVEHSGPDGAPIAFTTDAKSLDSRLDNLAAAATTQDDHGEPDDEGESGIQP